MNDNLDNLEADASSSDNGNSIGSEADVSEFLKLIGAKVTLQVKYRCLQVAYAILKARYTVLEKQLLYRDKEDYQVTCPACNDGVANKVIIGLIYVAKDSCDTCLGVGHVPRSTLDDPKRT